MKKGIIYSLVVFIIILSGCSTQSDQSTPQVISTIDTEWQVPQPTKGTGTIHGYLIGNDGEIVIGGSPFLSKNLSVGQSEIPPTISFSLTSDIRAHVNEKTGAFYFQDVPPANNYVIAILDGPGQIYIVRDSSGKVPLAIEIVAGQIIDLGQILVDQP